jgi:hypothetical protein
MDARNLSAKSHVFDDYVMLHRFMVSHHAVQFNGNRNSYPSISKGCLQKNIAFAKADAFYRKVAASAFFYIIEYGVKKFKIKSNL